MGFKWGQQALSRASISASVRNRSLWLFSLSMSLLPFLKGEFSNSPHSTALLSMWPKMAMSRLTLASVRGRFALVLVALRRLR